MYLKLVNDEIVKYPYSVVDLRKDNPQVSFPVDIGEAMLVEFGVFPVRLVDRPVVDHTKNVTEDTPKLVNGEWVQVWEVTPASNSEVLSRVLELRAAEYPPMADYLDGVVKGDQEQIQRYIDACIAVKLKYPKPTI